jgi:predicted nucleic acid-binding protein
VSNQWVVNASPIILLAKVGQIDLLPNLTAELVVPASVVAEIEAGPVSDPARAWLRGGGAKCVQPDLPVAAAIAAWDLGGGETAVLSWAVQRRSYEAILDDRAARKCAQIQGLPYRGTLGVILAAKKHGLIPAVKPLCEQVVQAGLLIEAALLQGALRLVGE